jgi:hypothetical protein
MKKLKFMVEISTEFLTDYAKSYEITDQLESLLSESVAKTALCAADGSNALG